MKLADVNALRNSFPKAPVACASTCNCGICSGGSGNCRIGVDGVTDEIDIKSIYTK